MAIIGTKISSVSTSGEIVGISASEVAQVLGEPLITDSVTGVTGDAVGYLCTSSKIDKQKWNIHKPINKSKYSKLDEADFKGESTDIANGIVYGLKAGINTKSLNDMHSSNWEYVGRPTSIFRLGDFDGYDHSIEAPSLSGSGLEDGQRLNYQGTHKVQLIWAAREGAISLEAVFNALQSRYSFADMYLCVLVGTVARACVNEIYGGVYPILYNNTQCNSFIIPSLGSTGTWPVTLFFASSDTINWNVNGATMRNNWVDISGLKFDTTLITVPNQVGKSINFVQQVMEYVASFYVYVQTYRGTDTLYFNITKGANWSSAYAYRVRWSVTDVNGNSVPTSVTTPIDYNVVDGSQVEGPASFTLVGNYALPNNSLYTARGVVQYQSSASASWVDTTSSSSAQFRY
jgi:hypothetical protein